MSAPNPELRRRVIAIYKELLHLGKDYPQGFSYFRPRLHRAFMANAQMKSEEEIEKGIERAEFVRKGMVYSIYSYSSVPTYIHLLAYGLPPCQQKSRRCK